MLETILRGALAFASGASLGAFLLSAGFITAGDVMLGFWCMGGAMAVEAVLPFVKVKPVVTKAPLGFAMLFGAGICAPLVAGVVYFRDRIVWAAVELNSIFLVAAIAGMAALLLMFVAMDHIRKAGEQRDLRARGELS